MLHIPVPRRGRSPELVADALAELQATVVERAALASIGEPGDSSGPQRRLFRYWTRGIGAAKIGWGTHGSFRRCVALLGKHLPPKYDVHGMCANLHKRATGEWPTEHGKAGIPS